MRITEALRDPQGLQNEINSQLRRAVVSVEERRERRQLLRAQTGITSRKPVASLR
jgi:hypothetical protein